MASSKKLVRKDVIRLARQKLWVDIGKAVDSYEKLVYGDLALTAKRKQLSALAAAAEDDTKWLLGQHADLLDKQLEARAGDITDPASILPPEVKKRSRRAHKPSPVSDHIRGAAVAANDRLTGTGGDDDAFDRAGAARAERDEVTAHVTSESGMALGISEEKVLILIAESAGGMTPAQIAIQIALKKRTIQNILTSLKSQRFIIKDANHGKFRATKEGSDAVKGRTATRVKGAILEKLSETERKVLFAIGSKKEGITLSALSVMVPGVKKRTKQNILTKLKTMELIEKVEDRYALTEYAQDELKGKLEKPLTGKALRMRLIETLPEPEALVIEWLSYDGGRTANATELAEALDYAPRTVQNIFTALKARELIVKHDGRFQLSSHLKD